MKIRKQKKIIIIIIIIIICKEMQKFCSRWKRLIKLGFGLEEK